MAATGLTGVTGCRAVFGGTRAALGRVVAAVVFGAAGATGAAGAGFEATTALSCRAVVATGTAALTGVTSGSGLAAAG